MPVGKPAPPRPRKPGGFDHFGHSSGCMRGDGFSESLETAHAGGILPGRPDLRDIAVAQQEVFSVHALPPRQLCASALRDPGRFQRSGSHNIQTISRLHLEHGRLITAARHITASTVTNPSGVVSPTWIPRFCTQLFQELFGAAQSAGQVGANLDAVFAGWLIVIEGIKTDDRATSVAEIPRISAISCHGLLR